MCSGGDDPHSLVLCNGSFASCILIVLCNLATFIRAELVEIESYACLGNSKSVFSLESPTSCMSRHLDIVIEFNPTQTHFKQFNCHALNTLESPTCMLLCFPFTIHLKKRASNAPIVVTYV